MDYIFIMWFLVFFINLILIFKNIPIFGIPLGIISIFFVGVVFLTDSKFFNDNGTANIMGYFMSMLLLVIVAAQMYINIGFVRGKH
jgi:hypothetical protein